MKRRYIYAIAYLGILGLILVGSMTLCSDGPGSINCDLSVFLLPFIMGNAIYCLASLLFSIWCAATGHRDKVSLGLLGLFCASFGLLVGWFGLSSCPCLG